MTIIEKSALTLILSFALGMILSPITIKVMKRLKAGQIILGYVEEHAGKGGTPTMGGVIFLLPLLITLIFYRDKMTIVALLTVFGYALIGFLDDFIKIKTHKNLGLKPYQKIIGQLGIAVILSLYIYKNPNIGTKIHLLFTNKTIDLSYFIIPASMFIFVATTNAVNLTDGLDGLAGSVSLVDFIALLIITIIFVESANNNGENYYASSIEGLAVLSACFIGGLSAFLWQNFNPSKIFMGDTGSLALGGGIATISLFLRNPFIILFLGIMFVWTCISVIVQVLNFKLTKKRVFLMAPYHHHLERKGEKEWNIVAKYAIITIIFATITIVGAVNEL